MVSDNPVDLDSLRNLANKTGGRVIEVTVDDSDIQQLVKAVERNMQLNGGYALERHGIRPTNPNGYYHAAVV